MHVNKRIDNELLQRELATAGVSIAGLGFVPTNGSATEGDLYTYQGGVPVDLPAAAEPVVTAHVAPPPPIPPDYGTDIQPADQLATAVTNLRAYIALTAPTGAQTTAAVKLLCRVVLFLLRRLVTG